MDDLPTGTTGWIDSENSCRGRPDRCHATCGRILGMAVEQLAQNLGLGPLLDDVRRRLGGYEILDHWQQGEFHHDLLLKVDPRGDLPGPVLVVATNCNGGVKELLCFGEAPERGALWKHRCPESPEFFGELPPILA